MLTGEVSGTIKVMTEDAQSNNHREIKRLMPGERGMTYNNPVLHMDVHLDMWYDIFTVGRL